MKKMLSTRFGHSMFILLFTVFMLFIWIQRETYNIPLFFEGIFIVLSAQLLPYFLLKLIERNFFIIKNLRLRIFTWFFFYLLFFLLIWFATSFFYSKV